MDGGWVDGGWVDDGWVDNRGVDGWMGGWVDRWMGEWMDGWGVVGLIVFVSKSLILMAFILKK